VCQYYANEDGQVHCSAILSSLLNDVTIIQ
jgi:hypothetical protein